jgi:cytochrome c oxidase subunit 3
MSEHDHDDHKHGTYYVPEHSSRPITTAIGLFFLGLGSILLTENPSAGIVLFIIGVLITGLTLIFWFRDVILENRRGLHDAQMDRTYRWGMFWYLISQAALVLTFFGAVFFARLIIIPGLGGHIDDAFKVTHLLLWPDFTSHWPLANNPDPSSFEGPSEIMTIWGWPLVNLLLVVLNVLFVISAQKAVKKNLHRLVTKNMMAVTLLGATFLGLHIYSLYEAIFDYGISLDSGIYGSTFVMINVLIILNVFITLLVMIFLLPRCIKGEFGAKHHFAIDAIAWLWYFIAAMWFLSFLFLYAF